MKLTFELEVIGYIIAIFEDDSQRIKVFTEDVFGDRFQELLNKFMFIYECREYNKSDYFPFSETILWEDCMVSHAWHLKLDSLQSDIEIEIEEVANVGDYKKSLLKCMMSLDDLFGYIYYSLHVMLEQFGFSGYKANWVGNFPIAEYIKLKSDKFNLTLKEISPEDDEWKKKLDLNDELKILSM